MIMTILKERMQASPQRTREGIVEFADNLAKWAKKPIVFYINAPSDQVLAQPLQSELLESHRIEMEIRQLPQPNSATTTVTPHEGTLIFTDSTPKESIVPLVGGKRTFIIYIVPKKDQISRQAFFRSKQFFMGSVCSDELSLWLDVNVEVYFHYQAVEAK